MDIISMNNHILLKNMCANFVSKDFSFPWELTTHRWQHTGEDMYPCTECPKKFTTNKIMLEHQKMHQNFVHTCPHCQKTFNIKCSMDQHVRGTHGLGWATPCGKTVDWPRKLSSHKCHCENCKAILLQRKCDALNLEAQIAIKNN